MDRALICRVPNFADLTMPRVAYHQSAAVR